MSGDDGLAWALRYGEANLRIFPVNARGAPLTPHGFKDASSDPEVIEAWHRERAHCDFGWAVPADIIAVDLDMKHGKNGFRDFKDRACCDPRDVPTPQATTPSGGMHLFYKATKPYKNAVAIDGTGISIFAPRAATSCCPCPATVADGSVRSSGQRFCPRRRGSIVWRGRRRRRGRR
jgi:Bifunctional DNA primase/polymerase, N-terminal